MSHMDKCVRVKGIFFVKKPPPKNTTIGFKRVTQLKQQPNFLRAY